MMRHTIMGAVAAIAIAAAGLQAGPALAEAKVLQAAACFPQGSFFAKRFACCCSLRVGLQSR